MYILLIPGCDMNKGRAFTAGDYAILEPENEEERKTLLEVVTKIQQAKDFRTRLPAMLKLLLPFIR